MAEIDIKAYATRAMELEIAIYTQKRLMKEHEKVLNKQCPDLPARRKIEKPIAPVRPLEPVNKGGNTNVAIWFLIIGVVMFVAGLMSVSTSTVLIGLAIAVISGFVIFRNKSDSEYAERIYQSRLAEFEETNKEYLKLMEQYEEKFRLADIEHSKSMEQYQKKMLEHNNNRDSIIKQHKSYLTSLEGALQKVYAENIIFPKYRNIVAITAINEYLQSGRCSELEGASGAYNLYEMELRQNIIIGQMSVIVDNLEQIRNNQYSLYSELTKANYTVNQIVRELRDMRQTTKLTAYFAGVSAQVAVSPKIYHGIVY